jgi:hypothetical protein
VALQLSPLRHFATIPGRHRVAHNHEGTQSINLVEKVLWMHCFTLLHLGCGPWGFDPSCQVCDRTVYANGHSFRLALAIQQPTLGLTKPHWASLWPSSRRFDRS